MFFLRQSSNRKLSHHTLSLLINPPPSVTPLTPPAHRRLHVPKSQPPSVDPTLPLPHNTVSDIVSLFCLVYGDSFNRAFEVKTEKQNSVAALKKLIKQENSNDFKSIDARHLKLWKEAIPITKEKVFQVPGLKDEDELSVGDTIAEHFDIPPSKCIHIIIKAPEPAQSHPTASNSLVSISDAFPSDFGPVHKCFKPGSRVHAGLRPYVYYADQTANNSSLITMIENGFYIRMYGPRASGKSSRTVEAMTILKSKGFECIYIDLQGVFLSNEERFWSELNGKFSRFHFHLQNKFNSSATFLEAFAKSDRWTHPVVIFIDEFDVLLNPEAKGVLSSLLSTLRPAKDNGDYIIQSVVSIGTFAITLLNQEDVNLSPFNATENFSGISLTKLQVQELFQEFANDRGISIDSKVIHDIYQLTNGHAGMVNVYGTAIDNDLLPLDDQTLNFTRWQKFAHSMLRRILAYPTFQRMVKSLTGQKEAVDFLWLRFLGNFDEFIPVPLHEKCLADFLAALGVLAPDVYGSKFKMSSPMIDSLVRQHVIPVVYPTAPGIPIPNQFRGGPLDFLSVLREVLKVFDRQLMTRAADCSYKTADVMVEGQKGTRVPRESVYDSELMRILTNWLSQTCRTVTGQWHLVDGGDHKYTDIVINDGNSKIALELLATGNRAIIQEHIDRADQYKTSIGACEAWVVHFTFEDDYLRHPLWQSEDLLNKRINVVHVIHDQKFESVRIGAKYMKWDDDVEVIENELVF